MVMVWCNVVSMVGNCVGFMLLWFSLVFILMVIVVVWLVWCIVCNSLLSWCSEDIVICMLVSSVGLKLMLGGCS